MIYNKIMLKSKGGESLKRKFLAVICAFLAIFLTSCSNSPKKSEERFFAMDTYMTIEAYGENAEKASLEAKECVVGLEKMVSVNDKNSEIYALNHGENPDFSRDTLELTRKSLEFAAKTNGAFDPTVYPITAAWGFTTGEKRVPDGGEIERLLEKVGYEKVSVSGEKIALKGGAELDFGGIAKGYASDKCAEIMRNHGVNSALINLGGNIYALGKRPDGELWRIGVADPLGENAEDNVGILSVSDCAVVTSGNYQRDFTQNGITYGHIIDPKTGYPAENDLLSVTIISPNGTLCDALSTALFTMGREGAELFYRENGDFDVIMIAENGEIFISEGLCGAFSFNRKVNVIKR